MDFDIFFFSKEISFDFHATAATIHSDFANVQSGFDVEFSSVEGFLLLPQSRRLVDVSATRTFRIPTNGTREVKLRLLRPTDFTTPLTFDSDLFGDQQFFVSLHHYEYGPWQSLVFLASGMVSGAKSLTKKITKYDVWTRKVRCRYRSDWYSSHVFEVCQNTFTLFHWAASNMSCFSYIHVAVGCKLCLLRAIFISGC